MRNNGVILTSAAVPAAYAICEAAWSGYPLDYLAGDVFSRLTDVSYAQAQLFVAAAITVYCPPQGATGNLYA
jgi:hypothetical protein